MANERINFYYDPAREGYDTTLWKTVSGTPTVASSKIRLNAAKIIGYADIFKGEVTYKLNIPTVPMAFLTGGNSATSVVATWNAVTDGNFAITVDGVAVEVTGLDFSGVGVTTMANVASIIQTGLRVATSDTTTTCVWSTNHFIITSVSAITVTSAIAVPSGTDISGAGGTAFMDSDVGHGTVTNASAREFGLQQMNCLEKLTFKIASGVLTAESLYDGTTSSTTIAWDSSWTATDTSFTVKWTGFSAEFLINGVRKVFLTDAEVLNIPSVKIPKKALSQVVHNTSSDNLDITFIEVNNVQGYI